MKRITRLEFESAIFSWLDTAEREGGLHIVSSNSEDFVLLPYTRYIALRDKFPKEVPNGKTDN